MLLFLAGVEEQKLSPKKVRLSSEMFSENMGKSGINPIHFSFQNEHKRSEPVEYYQCHVFCGRRFCFSLEGKGKGKGKEVRTS